MTREEREKAIKIFNFMLKDGKGTINHWNGAISEVRTALENAIEALKQEPVIDKVREEVIDTLYVDSLIFGELIDFKNGKISADDVIEEFNRVTRMEILHILDKYKAESEAKR